MTAQTTRPPRTPPGLIALHSRVRRHFGTYDAAAKTIGLSGSRLRRGLVGYDRLTVLNVLRLADALGEDPDRILREAQRVEEANLIRKLYGFQAAISKREAAWLKQLRRLTPTHAALVHDLTVALATQSSRRGRNAR